MTREVPVTQARADLAELVSRVGYSGERILLTRHGKALAALVPVSDLEELERPPAEIGFSLAPSPQPEPAQSDQPERRGGPMRIAAEHREQGRPRRER
ncbi:MAG: type II toxin-antitoxin system Phd/YefM family antitoxin [Actinoallomurus sp.]